MSSAAKPRRKADDNLWQNEKTGRWHWEICLKRSDDTVFRRGGSRKEKTLAAKDRDEAIAEFNRFEGRAGNWTIKTWGEHVEQEVWPHEIAETTLNNYRLSLKNHVYPTLALMRLSALTVPVLQTWANSIRIAHGREVTTSAIKSLSSLLTRAVQAGLIPANPARSIKHRKTRDVDEEYPTVVLTEEQQTALQEAAEGTWLEMPIRLGLKFGLRFGECLGLRWVDVDLQKWEIRIRQQTQSIKGKGVVIAKLKTKASYRELSIPPSLREVFAKAKEEATTLYVCMRNGELMSSTSSSADVAEIAVAAGFTDDETRPSHRNCRSTFLSYLANNANDGKGIKPHVLMGIAGHSSLATTMKYYARASDDDKAEVEIVD